MDRITVRGTPLARGRQYGQQAQRQIRSALERYRGLFARRAGLDWDDAAAHALGFVADIESFAPDSLLEMRGIAEGAGVPFETILVLNCRSELMFAATSRRGTVPPSECTSFAVTPAASADGHVLVGQNWDWVPFAREIAVQLEVLRDDKPSYMTIVEAGMLAKVGVNAAGLGLCTNTLVSSEDAGQRGVPYHVLLRALLDVASVDEAARCLGSTRRALSANYLVADRGGSAANFETTAGGAGEIRITRPQAGRLAHANHFLDPGFARIDAFVGHAQHSLTRLDAMARGLAEPSPLSVARLQAILRGHDHAPNGVCSHPDPAADPFYARCTVASIIADLTAGDVWFTDGPPCTSVYRSYRLPDPDARP
ncbi:MAG: C45 family autoproteolytic acyltransferase/hydrolase [Lautropia sp.]